LPTDERVQAKIADLVEDGVLSVAEMRRHINHYLRTELFAEQDLPPASDRRFFPTAVDFRNVIYRRRLTKLHSKINQVNLTRNIDNWTRENPQDCFYFREYCEDTCDHSAVHPSTVAEDDDVDVNMPSSQPGKGLLFCHQTHWQQQLLQRYGSEICLLDATYKTSRYALPLFFVCVKTNVNYAVVASFVVQCEDTQSIAEALSVIQQWNPSWCPQNWMVDFCEAEINALESVFPGDSDLHRLVNACCYVGLVAIFSGPH